MDNQFKRLELLKNRGLHISKVLDIGAYEGEWTKRLLQLYPDAKVTMVEGNTDKEAFLQPIGPYHIALLSDREKKVDYYKSQTNIGTGNGIYRENTNVPFKPEKRKTTTLEKLLQSTEGYDLIKMDVQGSEKDIIQGSLDIFTNSTFVLLEMQVYHYNMNAPLIGDMMSYMNEIGYQMHDLFDLLYVENVLINIDGLFINKSKL